MLTGDSLARLKIDDVLNRWPQTIAVFRKKHMSCVGCALAPYYTIDEAVTVYGQPLAPFLEELLSAINQHDAGVDE